MSNIVPSLSFDIFDQPTEQIDWPTMERFADAAIATPEEMIVPLMNRFDQLDAAAIQAMETGDFVPQPAGLVLIPSILGLAGPKLASSWQEQIARWLIDHLDAASKIDDDFKHEVLVFTGERLGEGGLTVAAERLLEIDPDGEQLLRTAWFALWPIAESCVKHAGQTEARRRLDEYSKDRLEQVIRECLDPDQLDQLIWYLIRSDRSYMEAHIERLLGECRDARPGRGARHNPALRGLRTVADYLRGDQEQIKLFDRPTDFRKVMQSRLDWLNEEPPAESETTFLDDAGSWDDEPSYDEDLPPLDVPETIVRETPRIGRNDPCPCGSGKKYKKCCMGG